MAVRGFDGLEHHGTSNARLLASGWNQIDGLGTIISTNKRTGTYAFKCNGSGGFVRNYNDIDPGETIVGLATGWYFGSLPDPIGHWVLAQFRNTSSRAHISVQPTALGRLAIILGGKDALGAGGTQIGVSADALQVGVFYHIETEFKLHATDGYVKIRVNGREFYELTGVPTNGALAGPDDIGAFAFGSFNSASASGFDVNLAPTWDDCAWWDSEVDAHHDGSFIGQHGVYYLPAIADGTYEEFLLSAGVDSFALVDEIEPDEDATYVFSDTVNQRVAFPCQAPPANVEDIECLQIVARAKKTETGDADLSLGVITLGAVEDQVVDYALSTNYFSYYGLYPVNPETAAPWNPAAMPEAFVERIL